MRTALRALGFGILALMVWACAAACARRISVSLDVPSGLQGRWEEILAGSPLPGGVEIGSAETARARAPNVVALASVRGTGKTPGDPHMRWKLVARSIRAPFVRLGNERASIAAGDLASGPVPTGPLEEISLPDVALPVDGVYPDQQGYPLTEGIFLGLASQEPRLLQWFDSIRELAPPRVLWIGAVGDVMPARGVDAELLRGIEPVFGDTLAELGSCDALLGNLEAAATTGGAAARKSYTFRFDPRALDALKKTGFTYLSVTNNHSFDFGPPGFLDTLRGLTASGIGTSGAGASPVEASRAHRVSRGGVELRILSFGAYPPEAGGFDGRRDAAVREDRPGILWLDDASLSIASREFSPGSFNIAMVHGGREWSERPVEEQKRLYRRLIEAGADLVVGSHPHVLQGMESVNGRLIAYSLGNFLFPGMDGTPGGEDSVILKIGVVTGKIRYVRADSVRLSGGAVRKNKAGTGARFLWRRTRELAGSR